MSTTADQLRRLMAFLPQIADGNEHKIASVAERLHVDAKTIVSDLHAMSERYGDPPGWVEKVQLFVEADRVSMEATRHFLRPMRLSGDEWRATELGLALLRAERPPDDRGVIESALEKVRELMSEAPSGEAPSRAASLGAGRHVDAITPLRSAMRDRKRVEIVYQKGSGDQPDRRTVCPVSFAVEQGVWYLVASCDRSDAIRIFRLDRVIELKVLADGFEPPADLTMDELLADGRAFVGDPPEKLRVRYSPKVARWISEREQGTKLEDGSFEVEYPMGDSSWAMRHVLQYGPEAEVIAPAEVREALVERLRSIVA